MSTPKPIQTDVLVVGAGIAGLLAAKVLTQQGLRVIIAEKESVPGGRLATRRVGPGQADSGAQFFSVRSPEFQTWTSRWQAEGLIRPWSLGWSNVSLGVVPPDGSPCYMACGGMSALAGQLSQGLDLRLSTPLVSTAVNGRYWLATDAQDQTYACRALLLTPPVPQALVLLSAGQVPLTDSDRATLGRFDYVPCLAGLFWVDGEIRLPEPGAVQRANALISWVADNRRKGISPDARIITVHAGPTYSRQLWDQPDSEVLRALESGLQLFKDADARLVEAHLVRWHYALPITIHNALYLMASDLPPLAFAGDAFGSPRVEGAAQSGLAAGAALAEQLV